MKTVTSILALFINSITTALPQSVIHLNQGDSYTFFNPAIVNNQTVETPLNQFFIYFGFTGDQFTLGESAHVNILANPTSTTPLLSMDFTNTINNPGYISTNQIALISTGIPWNAQIGAIQFTMVSGSVDISSITAITYSQYLDRFTFVYTIPEPNVPMFILLGGVAAGATRWLNRRRKYDGNLRHDKTSPT